MFVWRVLASWIICVVVVGSPGAHAKNRRRGKRVMPHAPRGWTWPPSAAMKTAGDRCLRQLDALGVVWKKAKQQRKISTPVVVPGMEFGGVRLVPIFRKPPFVMDCHLAWAFARHGKALYDAGIRQLRFSTIHDYRRVRTRGQTQKALSRHALGLAVDVYEMIDKDRKTLVVKRDYSSGALDQADVVVQAASGFRKVLTPKNDPRSHHDHVHFEARMNIGGSRMRRTKRWASSKSLHRRRALRSSRRRKRLR